MNGEGWGVSDAAALVAAIDRELAERDSADAELVRKGRLDQREADYRRDLIGSIRADLVAAFGEIDGGQSSYQPGEAMAVAWANKVRWIEHEIEARRADYPELIRKGRLTEDDAKLRLRAIKALRRLYWEKLFMWSPPPGPGLEYLRSLQSAALSRAPSATREQLRQSEGAQIYRELVRRHLHNIELEANGQGRLVA